MTVNLPWCEHCAHEPSHLVEPRERTDAVDSSAGHMRQPTKKGNSHFLLGFALEAARETAPGVVETELYSLAG